MIALVYDKDTINDPDALGASLGIGTLVDGVPERYAGRVTIPAAGYVVVRETWAGLDILPGPVTRAQIDALPDPGTDPSVVEQEVRAAQSDVLSVIASTPIDTAALRTNLDYLAAFVTNPSVQAVPEDVNRLNSLISTMSAYVVNPSPTNAESVAAIKAACESSVIVDRVTLAILADVIRYILK